MANKFDLFLKQHKFMDNPYFENVQLHQVRVKASTKTWVFLLRFQRALPIKIFEELASKLQVSFQIVNKVENVGIEITCESDETDHLDMMSYWHAVIGKLADERPRFSSFRDFTSVTFQKNIFDVHVDNESLHLTRYVPDIKDAFAHYGLNVDITLSVCDEVETATQLVEKRSEEALKEIEVRRQEMVENPPPKDKKDIYVGNKKYNKSIKEPAVKINTIPIDQNDLLRHENEVGIPLFVIQGEIFHIDIKTLKEFTLAEIKITDGSDSITIKKFLRHTAEINTLNKLSVGDWIKASGKATFDNFSKDVLIMAEQITYIPKPKKHLRTDQAVNKRVELHLHTKMSNMDAVTDVKDYVERAVAWNHKAIAFTDHAGLYAYPEIAKVTKGKDIKPIYGVEMDFIDEKTFKIALSQDDVDLKKANFVVFDLETTGLSVNHDDIIEIGAVKMNNGGIIDHFSTFVKPTRPIGKTAASITGITKEMLVDAPDAKEAIAQFLTFAEGAVLVAHNATFDMGHLIENCHKLNLTYPHSAVIDTLQLARAFYADDLKRFNLKAVAKLFKVKLEQHHRALDDAKATADIFTHMLQDLYKKGIVNNNQINAGIDPTEIWKYAFPSHVNLLVKNRVGYKNLFKLVSDALTDHFHHGARVLKNVLETYREGLLVGSGCVNGRVFEAALNRPYEELLAEIDFYDYIEIQPPSVIQHLALEYEDKGKEIIEKTIEMIIKAAQSKDKMVVATGDVHHLDPSDRMFREIYVRTPVVGGGIHPLAKFDKIPSQHFMTTDEMLKEFAFLGTDLAYEIVVTNTNLIADGIDPIQAFKKTLYSPKDNVFKDKLNVPSINEAVKTMTMTTAKAKYGDPLPLIIADRIEQELGSIITNDFAGVYYMSHLLVKKSRDEGYLVGSRGSVGSSLVATLLGITEVNPIRPHYVCPACQFSVFKLSEDEKKHLALNAEEKKWHDFLDHVESGYDLPRRDCPSCGTPLAKDGHDIPFETFLGFSGDKVPDIDLNFSGDYQGKAHAYIRDLLGANNTFRSGTIQTVAERNAFGYVKGYLEEKNLNLRNAEVERLAKKIEGVKRSTGQHPGGIVVVPDYVSIYDITPIQYPADDIKSGWKTTHFDYHSFEDNLLKLDILGHDDPTVIKYLMDYVELHPEEFPFSQPEDIPLDDKEVYKLFSGTAVIDLKPEELNNSTVASFAIPEFGTGFTRQMLTDTKPTTFAGLVKISGLSHGTDVWIKNAQDLVKGSKPEFGKIPFEEVIGCRDDIMVYLMYQGLEPLRAFEIMEFVRKGKPTKDRDKWKEYEAEMNNHRIPSWYIWSCEQIKYMFPKAHATAYVLMAMRIAWFKIHKPILFYSAYFSKRAEQFDVETMVAGSNAIRNRLKELEVMYNPTKKEEDLITVFYVALEMTRRGMKFLPIDIGKSAARDFIIEDNHLRLPFISLDGLGINVAEDVVFQREEKPFVSKKDVVARTKLNKTHIEKLTASGCFDDLDEEDDQLEHGLFAIDA